MANDFVEARTKITSVLAKRGALETILKNRFDDLLNTMERVVYRTLREMGTKLQEAIRNEILNNTSSGRHYTYIDAKSGETITEHTASAEGGPPVNFTGLLVNSIKFRVRTSNNSVEVGVDDTTLWEYKTIAYYGWYEKKWGKIRIPDVVIVDTDKGKATPVNKYANILEGEKDEIDDYDWEGTGMRPFFYKTYSHKMEELKKEYRKKMKEEVLRTMRKKKLPIYFKISIS